MEVIAFELNRKLDQEKLAKIEEFNKLLADTAVQLKVEEHGNSSYIFITKK